MRLTDKEIAEYRIKLSRLAGTQALVYDNGIFEFHNVDQIDKDRIVRNLRNTDFVEYINATKSRYNFNKFSFNKGFAEPENYYTIRGSLKDETDLYEDIEIHDELNPKLWGEDKELLPEVKDKILDIIAQFKKDLTDNKVNLVIDDVYIIGSNANFNYTDKSDLDVHIIADESDDCEDNHLPVIYNAYKTIFNNKYDISINGISVELYVENKEDIQNISSGEYSLEKGWIKEPSVNKIPKIDEAKLEANINEWESRYLELIKNPSIEEIDKYLNDIYKLRQDSVKEHNEFAIGNLTFKEMRNLGYLDDLKSLRIDLQSKELSL